MSILANTKKQLYGLQCGEEGEILWFLDGFIKIRDELAGLGGKIDDKEYVSIII